MYKIMTIFFIKKKKIKMKYSAKSNLVSDNQKMIENVKTNSISAVASECSNATSKLRQLKRRKLFHLL